MSDTILNQILARDPNEKEFYQAVSEFIETVKPVLDRHLEYRRLGVLERITEPERLILLRITIKRATLPSPSRPLTVSWSIRKLLP